MSRFLLLIVFMIWMSGGARPSPEIDPAGINPAFHGPAVLIHDLERPATFVTGYLILVLITGIYSRRLTRQMDASNMSRSLRRFNRLMGLARLAIPAWFFVGVYWLGWASLVGGMLSRWRLGVDHFDAPGLLVGSLPALVAWMGLWWAQYPADICFREQGLLAQLDAGLPIHRPPPLASYLAVNLRLQLLFTVAPVFTLVLLRDLISAGLAPLGLGEENSAALQLGISILTAAIVLLFSPELLIRLLTTEPMPQSPLRRRLEGVCRRHGIRYRDVLLWRTDHNMGNAAVMGLIPQVRYILMSDLLLETMTDEQIEAVFAHEVGHIIHRHMLWFAVFFGAMMFALVGMSQLLETLLQRFAPQLETMASQSIWASAFGTLAAGLGCLSVFLFLSRKFERQADVFAARTMQEEPVPAELALAEPPQTDGSHVGLRGAAVFSSALHRVAMINCIPLTAWSWCHGSIAKRIDYLQELSLDRRRTQEFDQFMSRIRIGLMIALCGFGVWAMVTLVGQG